MPKKIGVVLGTQTSLGSIIKYAEDQRKGRHQKLPSSFTSQYHSKHIQINNNIKLLSDFCTSLIFNGAEIHWTGFTINCGFEIPLLMQNFFKDNFNKKSVCSLNEFGTKNFDFIIYLPLDVVQSKKIEHLARLSMFAKKGGAAVLSSGTRNGWSQMISLQDKWSWIDINSGKALNNLAGDILFGEGNTPEDFQLDTNSNKDTRSKNITKIITRSPLMKDILALVDSVADTDSTILITGDSGTGKELISKRLHTRSQRANNKFVAINCAAIPNDLIESELFGHVKGSFTGAVNDRVGCFKDAVNGTLFLDEVADLSKNMQVKLLRVLQEKVVKPVGGSEEIEVNCRIVAATNKNLEEEVASGNFREDLFYRLNVIPVFIPSLRDRVEDIELLVEHFIRKTNIKSSRSVTGISSSGIRGLAAYKWPGNIRELENLVERLVVLKSSGMIDLLDFPEKYRRESLSEIEYLDILRASSPGHRQQSLWVEKGTFKIEGGNIMEENNVFGRGVVNQTAGVSQANEPTPNPQRVEANGYGNKVDSLTVDDILRFIDQRFAFPDGGLDFNLVIDIFENILIMKALNRTGWNRNRAAGLLKLNRTTLVEKLKKKQLMPPPEFSHKAPRTKDRNI